MTAVNRATLYTYFETGDFPSQQQFANLIDSNLNLATTSAQAITADVSALGKLDITGQITGKNAIVVGSPTGGNKGVGTVNATGLYINGTLVTTSSAGSGTVNVGVSGQIAYYNANSNTVAGISTLPSLITVATASAADNSGLPASTQFVNTNAFTTKVTWTPTLAFGGASVGIIYSIQTGNYIKIGKYIIAEFAIVLTNKGSSSGVATITGLPFSANTTGVAILSSYAGMTVSAETIQGGVNGTVISLTQPGTSSSSPLTEANFNNNTTLTMTAVYISA